MNLRVGTRSTGSSRLLEAIASICFLFTQENRRSYGAVDSPCALALPCVMKKVRSLPFFGTGPHFFCSANVVGIGFHEQSDDVADPSDAEQTTREEVEDAHAHSSLIEFVGAKTA